MCSSCFFAPVLGKRAFVPCKRRGSAVWPTVVGTGVTKAETVVVGIRLKLAQTTRIDNSAEDVLMCLFCKDVIVALFVVVVLEICFYLSVFRNCVPVLYML
jgi:hypothetical protein